MDEKKIKAAKKLIGEIDEVIRNNEHNTVKYKGIGNLSRSDLEEIIFYTEEYIRSGSFDAYRKPLGGVKSVLEKCGLLE